MRPWRSWAKARSDPGGALADLAAPVFERIHVDPSWVAAAEQAAARGPVVYVLRNASSRDYLALSHLVRRHGLPRIGFVNELAPVLRPRHLGLTPPRALWRTIEEAQSAVLFVKRAPPRGIQAIAAAGTLRGRSEGDALLAELVAWQRRHPERELMLLPQTLVWTLRPEQRGFSVVDALFGPADFPGEMRMVVEALLNADNCRLCAGTPLSLREFLEREGAGREGAADDAALLRRLTYALLGKVERERRTLVGPAHKPPDRVRQEVLRSPRLQRLIGELAGPSAEARAALTAQAERMLEELQTVPDPEAAASLEALADQVLPRLFAGIDVDDEGIAEVRRAASTGSVVLLPSHKSHVDYIVLSYVLRKHGIQLPVIAAGDNLSFFPLGPVLRRVGAFFIRRSFRGDRLYTAVVSAYVRRLLRDGWVIEFFPEGGRSRSGKLLPPMLGLLNMIVEAGLRLQRRRVAFVPISIGYERLVEESAFARELSGKRKTPEDARALLSLGDVFRDRWGRVNLQFGLPIWLDEVREELDVPAGSVRPAKRRAIVKRLAHQAMRSINAVTAVTPAALIAIVLLGEGQRGVPYRTLLAQCERLSAVLAGLGARPSKSLLRPDGSLRERAIRDALTVYVHGAVVQQHVPGDTLTAEARKRAALYAGSDVIFTVPRSKRLRLDFAKNTVLHHFVDRGLLALGFGGGEAPEPVEAETLRSRVRDLSRLFKYEFMFRADAGFDRIFDELVERMTDAGELVRDGDQLAPGPGRDGRDGHAWLADYAAMLRNFVEGYFVAARALRALIRAPLDDKGLVDKALREGERMHLEGTIERSEAVSGPIMKGAISAFVDQGYLVREAGQLALAPSLASEAALGAIEGRLVTILRACPRHRRHGAP